jgi:integrase
MAFLNMKYIVEIKRRGRVYYYYRRDGRYWGRLPGEPGSAKFSRAYEALNNNGWDESPAEADTFNAAIVLYIESAKFQARPASTKKTYLVQIAKVRDVFGPVKLTDISRKHITAYRNKIANKPATANIIMAVLSQIFKAAIDHELIENNPASNFGNLPTGEYLPWPENDIKHFMAQASPDMAQAASMALYTGQRKGDCLKMLWSDIEDGGIWVTQEKTGKRLWIPIHEDLQKVISDLPACAVTILTHNGRPWATANFDKIIRQERKRLGIDYVFHGLRKNAATRLADVGCSAHQISAITGQSLEMVAHYTKAAEQKKLAKSAILMLEKNKNRT